jgi:hypothetical protein
MIRGRHLIRLVIVPTAYCSTQLIPACSRRSVFASGVLWQPGTSTPRSACKEATRAWRVRVRRRTQRPSTSSAPRVDNEAPHRALIRIDPLFTTLRAHRRIDHIAVVTSNLTASGPTPPTSGCPIYRGAHFGRYNDALAQGIGDLDAPGTPVRVLASDIEYDDSGVLNTREPSSLRWLEPDSEERGCSLRDDQCPLPDVLAER